jgi:general stress protein YciG
MICPNCNFNIDDKLVVRQAARIIGSMGRGLAKARDPKKMSKAGKKGGWKKGRPRKPKESIPSASNQHAES